MKAILKEHGGIKLVPESNEESQFLSRWQKHYFSLERKKDNEVTPEMKRFIDHNKISKVVFSELLTQDNKPLMTGSDADRCDRAIYRFKDGSEFIIKDSDKRSAPDFVPVWDW